VTLALLVEQASGTSNDSSVVGANVKEALDNLKNAFSKSFVFGSASPLAVCTLPANAILEEIKVIIDTPFTGGITPATLEVGIAGNTAKYVATTDINLAAAAGTIAKIENASIPVGTTEAIIGTYAQGTATAGAGRIIVKYVIL
jgi:hypothetical protein